ncbi:GntR family transcriptional regulator [Bradyrhizobium sp. URHD0069]|uniref:GntR family transcriptional regulator n=1 Tax=Bradyrhizobium sp. URHD0069 TaxID=1380355 RepID=UPI00049570A9|nr:GntR family transcriptional regulator [Bradyrhizobium sp. URHD0069]
MVSKLLKSYDRSRVPLYIQVASVMRNRIQSGLWSPGQKISTLEELEREFEVARVTVRQAVEVLNEEGLLEARQGRGTFVSSEKQDRHWLQLATGWNSLVTSLEDNVPEMIVVEKAGAPPHLDEGDGKLAARYVRLCSVQYKNEEPYSVVNLHLARTIFDMNPKRFMTAAALPTIDAMDSIALGEAHQTLVVGSADPEIADLLKIPLGAATMQCRCIVIDDKGIAIYVANIVYRSDCIKLRVDLLGTKADRKKRAGGGDNAVSLFPAKSRKAL